MKVTNLELNGNSVGKIAKRVMKDRNIHIVDKFTPVISEHIINIKPDRRIILRLTEDTFTSTEQHKYANKGWKTILKSITDNKSMNDLENDFINSVIDLKNMYKNIK